MPPKDHAPSRACTAATRATTNLQREQPVLIRVAASRPPRDGVPQCHKTVQHGIREHSPAMKTAGTGEYASPQQAAANRRVMRLPSYTADPGAPRGPPGTSLEGLRVYGRHMGHKWPVHPPYNQPCHSHLHSRLSPRLKPCGRNGVEQAKEVATVSPYCYGTVSCATGRCNPPS